MPLFTAEGERAWAPGWEPVFADDPHPDEPGQVWTTNAHGVTTVWVTVARSSTSATYARVTPGDSAGTVTVTCRDVPEGCKVEVAYDLSALSEAGHHRLQGFAHGFDVMLEQWQRLTRALL